MSIILMLPYWLSLKHLGANGRTSSDWFMAFSGKDYDFGIEFYLFFFGIFYRFFELYLKKYDTSKQTRSAFSVLFFFNYLNLF